jgi:hypothetical protein
MPAPVKTTVRAESARSAARREIADMTALCRVPRMRGKHILFNNSKLTDRRLQAFSHTTCDDPLFFVGRAVRAADAPLSLLRCGPAEPSMSRRSPTCGSPMHSLDDGEPRARARPRRFGVQPSLWPSQCFHALAFLPPPQRPGHDSCVSVQ